MLNAPVINKETNLIIDRQSCIHYNSDDHDGFSYTVHILSCHHNWYTSTERKSLVGEKRNIFLAKKTKENNEIEHNTQVWANSPVHYKPCDASIIHNYIIFNYFIKKYLSLFQKCKIITHSLINHYCNDPLNLH